MNDLGYKTIGIMVYLITLPKFFSAISSLVVIVYFVSMLKMNVVDGKYKGSWKVFFKAWFLGVFKRKK